MLKGIRPVGGNDGPGSQDAPMAEVQPADTHALLKQLDQRVAHLTRAVESATHQATHSVTVKDIEMSFGSMVVFIVKWTIAAIPALIILTILGYFAAGALIALFAALISGLGR